MALFKNGLKIDSKRKNSQFAEDYNNFTGNLIFLTRLIVNFYHCLSFMTDYSILHQSHYPAA